MDTATANPLTEYQWSVQPEAQRLVDQLVADFLGRCPQAARLAMRMKEETGTRFPDWIDHIALPAGDSRWAELGRVGYVAADVAHERLYRHPKGMFPVIVQADGRKLRIAIKVESVVDVLSALEITFTHEIEGDPLSPLRRVVMFRDADAELWAIERHGLCNREPFLFTAEQLIDAARHLDAFRRRTRDFAQERDGFAYAHRIIDYAIADLGVDWTCDLFFRAEREYWQRRNHAAQVQKARQDRLGLGWGNHDHHTYRSSREHFRVLVGVWEKLGFHCRERFYAGKEAGWGAQVMEQPNAGIITFNDVDLSPEELMGDFSHDGLAPKQSLGTVGLWCALHGEAFLQAGMHHLEAQFDFNSLRAQLETAGVKMMKPFTNFPHLTQAFTEGERWPVRPERIERLLSKGQVTPQQAEDFRKNGAIGSHLENLERNDGFKGFNQTGVSEIISATDPRKHAAVSGA